MVHGFPSMVEKKKVPKTQRIAVSHWERSYGVFFERNKFSNKVQQNKCRLQFQGLEIKISVWLFCPIKDPRTMQKFEYLPWDMIIF